MHFPQFLLHTNLVCGLNLVFLDEKALKYFMYWIFKTYILKYKLNKRPAVLNCMQKYLRLFFNFLYTV